MASTTTQRTSVAARGGNAAGGLLVLIARLIRFIFGIAAAIIVVAIVLRLLNANPSNQIVHDFHTWGFHLAGPFRSLFTIHKQKVAMLVNWGVAAIVISVVGDLLARLVARIGLTAAGR
jgi:CDP-diglyceride synthetase